jgi:hypothetical protein
LEKEVKIYYQRVLSITARISGDMIHPKNDTPILFSYFVRMGKQDYTKNRLVPVLSIPPDQMMVQPGVTG